MLFRDTRTRADVERDAKKAGVKYIKQTSMNDLLEKVKKLEITPRETRTLVELRQIAKTKGIKRINSYSKKELIEKLEKLSISDTPKKKKRFDWKIHKIKYLRLEKIG